MVNETPERDGHGMGTAAPLALQISSLSKSFAGVQVLRDVSVDIRPGEVHALLGQNGSGKSTLIKCLAGVHRPDAATIEVAGRHLPHSMSPNEARKYGLAFVHQDLGLVNDMTVAENLAIGVGFERRGPLISWRAQRQRAARVLGEFGLDISPDALISDLPVTARTLIAIARVFQNREETNLPPLACLILDEPTASLPDNDAGLLFQAIDRVTASGVGVGYVTHRLGEVFQLASRATILRDGVVTATLDVAGLDPRGLFSAIVGRAEVARQRRTSSARDLSAAPVVLKAKGLSGHRVQDASLSLRSGEIVGVAGLAGSGRSELARLLFGAQATSSGSREVNGRALRGGSISRAMAAGVALVPEDRRRDGCVLDMSITENVTLAKLDTNRLGLLDPAKEKRVVRGTIGSFDIRPADPDRALSTLSGGNQQKVVLAKWLARKPRVLILDEPVQGVDVGAKEDIFTMLRVAAAEGVGVLVIDSDFDNLAQLCDRVLVMRGGRLVDELSGRRMNTETMSSSTFGVDDTELIHEVQSKEIV